MSKQGAHNRRVAPSRQSVRETITTREIERELRTYPRFIVREV